MPRSLKTLLLYLLLLALPVQGFAAAVRLSCSSDHRWMNGAAVTSVATVAVAHNHHHHYPQMSSAGSHAEHGSAGQLHDQSDSSSCSACAACCIGMAVLSSDTPVVKPLAVSFAPPAMPGPFFASHFPANPERPPRVLSA